MRNLKEALKTCEFDRARIMVRFLSDLVNCHVIVAGSLLTMFDNFVEVTLEDNIPQVRHPSSLWGVGGGHTRPDRTMQVTHHT